MAIKDKATLRAQAQQIRDETQRKANTALRVGGQHEDQNDSALNIIDADDQRVAGNVTFEKNAGVSGKLIAFSTSPTFDVDNSNIQEMPVTSALTSINISGAAAGGNYRILLKNGVSGPYTYPSLGTSFGTATTNSSLLSGDSKVMNMIDVQVTVSTPIVVTHSIETVTLP